MRIFLAMLLLTLPAGAQVVFQPHFEAERVDRFRLEATLTLDQQGDESVDSRTLEHIVDFRVTTIMVDPAGQAIVSLAFERVDVTLSEGDIQEHVVWPGEADPTELGEAWSLLTSQVYRLTIDPNGRIRTIEGLEALAERFTAINASTPDISLGLFAPGALKRTLLPIWAVDFTGEERRPGDDWRIADRFSISGQRRVQVMKVYTLDRVEAPHAELGVKISIEALPVESPTIVNVTVDASGDGAAEWNTDRGILDHMQERTIIALEASLEDEPPIKTTMTRRLNLTRLDDDS